MNKWNLKFKPVKGIQLELNDRSAYLNDVVERLSEADLGLYIDWKACSNVIPFPLHIENVDGSINKVVGNSKELLDLFNTKISSVFLGITAGEALGLLYSYNFKVRMY